MPDLIPDTDHVLRHVNALCHDNGEIQGQAFAWQPKQLGDGCSVNWVERANGADRPAQIAHIRGLKRRQWKESHRLAILNSGAVRRILSGKLAELGLAADRDVIHDRLPSEDRYPLADDTHALITGIPHDDSPEALAVRASLVGSIVEVLAAPPDPTK